MKIVIKKKVDGVSKKVAPPPKKAPPKKVDVVDEQPDEDVKQSASESDVTEDWFAEGDEEDEKFKNTGLIPRGYRITVGKGEERDVTFISSKPFTVREHGVYMKKLSQRQFTCLEKSGKGRCPFCEAKMTHPNSVIGNSAVVKAFWVVDHLPYKKKDGTMVKQSCKLLVMKTASYSPLKKIVSKVLGNADFSYTGLRVTLMRSESSTSPNTGDSFHVVSQDNAIPKGEMFADKTLETLKKEFYPQDREALLPVVDYILSSGETNSFDNEDD